eukprot:4833880-Pleurochrysis_carterae.AAC.3
MICPPALDLYQHGAVLRADSKSRYPQLIGLAWASSINTRAGASDALAEGIVGALRARRRHTQARCQHSNIRFTFVL